MNAVWLRLRSGWSSEGSLSRCWGLGGGRFLRKLGGDVGSRSFFNLDRGRSRDAFRGRRGRGSGLARNFSDSGRVLNDRNGFRIGGFARVITLDRLFFEETENVVEHKVTVWLFSQEKGLHEFTPWIRVI